MKEEESKPGHGQEALARQKSNKSLPKYGATGNIPNDDDKNPSENDTRHAKKDSGLAVKFTKRVSESEVPLVAKDNKDTSGMSHGDGFGKIKIEGSEEGEIFWLADPHSVEDNSELNTSKLSNGGKGLVLGNFFWGNRVLM
jgi:hypothetical protein